MPEEFHDINRLLVEIREVSERRHRAQTITYACAFALALITLVALLGAG